MKTTIFLTIAVVLLIRSSAHSQNPTYILDVNDGALVAPNIFEFDIEMTWTNSGVASNFEYAGGQYFFNIDTAIKNGGTLSYIPQSSDLPSNMRPRGPSIFLNTVTTGPPGTYQLRLAVNTFPGAGSGFNMPSNTAIKIYRMRLTTTSTSFANVPINLNWRNALPNPFTKIFAYVGTTNTDISTPLTHSISIPGFFVNVPYTITTKIGIEGLAMNNVHLRKDSVKIFIRDSAPPYQILDSGTSMLDSVTLTATKVTALTPGNYYIVIKHRNSLETWSKPGGEPLGNGNYFYDFTSSASQAYGNNLILKGNTYCIYSGNINGDDIIDAEDLIYVDNDVYNYAPGTNITNLNGDQIVDIEDLAICEKNARALRIVQWPGGSLLPAGDLTFRTRNFNSNISKDVGDMFTGSKKTIVNP